MADEHPAPAMAGGFAAALLCGGKSSRMGQDKAWLPWEGSPLWQLQLEKLSALNPARLLISCRSEQEIAAPGAELLPDPPGNAGPLPAILRCLERVRMPLLVLAVDMPRMSVPLLRSMAWEGVREDSGVMYHDHAAGYEPLAAVYGTGMLTLLRAAVARKNFRLQNLAEAAFQAGLLRLRFLNAEEVPCFRNVNSPNDLDLHG